MVASRHLDVMPSKDVAVWPARHLCFCLIVVSGDPENVEEPSVREIHWRIHGEEESRAGRFTSVQKQRKVRTMCPEHHTLSTVCSVCAPSP